MVTLARHRGPFQHGRVHPQVANAVSPCLVTTLDRPQQVVKGAVLRQKRAKALAWLERIIGGALRRVEVVQSDVEEEVLDPQVGHRRQPPIEVLYVAVSRLPVYTGVNNADVLAGFPKLAGQHILPSLPLGDIALVGRASSDGQNVYATRMRVETPKAKLIPFIDRLAVSVTIQRRDIKRKRPIDQQVQSRNAVR